MPDQQRSRQIVALALMASAVMLAVVAGLLYTGVIPMAEGTRFYAALAVGIAAFADFGIGLMFFRMSQSS